jgi:two-component system sensor histidine kinase PilS (NtrC family)
MDASSLPDQNTRILQIYNVYRVALAIILLLSFLTGATTIQLGNHNPALFLYATLAYLGFSLLVLFALRPEQSLRVRQGLLSALFIIDILSVALLTYSSRGVLSGLGLLHLVTIAAGSILLAGRMSTFLAAIASIAIIYSELYLSFTRNVPANQYLQSGLLGALLFATALYLQALAERMRRSALLATQQASDILSLEQLNHLIIKRMRTGILVLGQEGNIVSTNDAANQMLALQANDGSESTRIEHPTTPLELPEILLDNLNHWKSNKTKRPPTFSVRKSGPQLQANFTYLTPDLGSSVLVFLEDSSQIIQRVRKMKLASLGRLTASIAHEIRNPLGAISHASQLLAENPLLSDADRRLLDIIMNHSARINLIIEDVLHMSRHKHVSTERINLHDWLTRFVENYCEAHQINGNISIDILPRSTEVRVITNQFEQILNNLVENGLRYSEKITGRQSLLLTGGLSDRGGNNMPVLHVIDDGPGIDAMTEENLFEPFHTTEATGTGLGLYISKELCEANQAQLSYKRTEQGKSCFSIHFAHPDRNID